MRLFSKLSHCKGNTLEEGELFSNDYRVRTFHQQNKLLSKMTPSKLKEFNRLLLAQVRELSNRVAYLESLHKSEPWHRVFEDSLRIFLDEEEKNSECIV